MFIFKCSNSLEREDVHSNQNHKVGFNASTCCLGDWSLIIISIYYFELYFILFIIMKSSLTLKLCRECLLCCVCPSQTKQNEQFEDKRTVESFPQWHLRSNLNQNDLRLAPRYPPWNVCQCGDRAIYPAIHCNWLETHLEQTLIPGKKWGGSEVRVCVCLSVCGSCNNYKPPTVKHVSFSGGNVRVYM